MIKTYVYFTEEQDAAIKKAAKQKGKSKAWVIRDAVTEVYTAEPKKKKSKYINIEEAFASLRGTVLKYQDPFEPAVDPNDWEVLKE